MADVPQTLDDVFPARWLYAADLDEGGVVVTVASVEQVLVRNQDRRAGRWIETEKVAVFFQEDERGLIFNRTQGESIAAIAGSRMLADWVGVSLLLVPGVAPNKKPTINVQRPQGQLAQQHTTVKQPAQKAQEPHGKRHATAAQRREIVELYVKHFDGDEDAVNAWLIDNGDPVLVEMDGDTAAEVIAFLREYSPEEIPF